MASLSPPIGGRVRGPLRDGSRIEAAITTGKLLGVEVVVAAGEAARS
jgi:hypothetical protein